MRIRSLNHSTYQHQYHIVWGTRYRRKYLTPYVREELLRSMHQLFKKYPTLDLLAINSDVDHVHVQVEIPPNVEVSRVVQRMKIHTSKALKKRYAFIRRIYVDGSIWSVGYFSSTVGLNEGVIARYIAHQGARDLPRDVEFS